MEEELEGEEGGSRGEGRRTGGDLSSRRRKARGGGAVQIGAHQKDKQRAKASFSDLVYLFLFFFNSSHLLSAEACLLNNSFFSRRLLLPGREYGTLHRRLRPSLNSGLRLLCQGLRQTLLAVLSIMCQYNGNLLKEISKSIKLTCK